MPFYRQRITIWGNRVASRLFGMGIKDCTNGFRAVRLSMIYPISFQENGFAVIMEELFHLKLQGARVVEIPYVLTAREDESGGKFSYSPTVIWSYLKYALRAAIV